MYNLKNQGNEFLIFQVVQSGEIIRVSLTPMNLRKKFDKVYLSLLKELKLKQKDTFLSNEQGKMIGTHDINLTLEDIIKKFGTKLKVYYEKIF